MSRFLPAPSPRRRVLRPHAVLTHPLLSLSFIFFSSSLTASLSVSLGTTYAHSWWIAGLKKNRKKRGHVSAGHGRVGKARKHSGGRGNAGGQHHHRINFDKYHPGYFGKVGMRYFHLNKNKYHCPVINVDKIQSLVPEEALAKSNAAKAAVVDVTAHGFFKVLGKGAAPSVPLVVKAKFFSKLAEKRIVAAGGACVLTA